MGRYFDISMSAMGAERVHKYGEGNAEKNRTEDDFIEWKMSLWKDLAKYYSQQDSAAD